MADVATPSAAAIFDAAAEKAKPVAEKPNKPDEDAYKVTLKKAEKEHQDSMSKFNAIKAKVDLLKGNNKDNPNSKRVAELKAEMDEIKAQQAGDKAGRSQTQELIKKEEEKIQALISEQKTAKGRVAFKSTDELDREIARLEKQVDSGLMKLVEERKALSDISTLRKQRKNFAGFDETQKKIDELKAKVKELSAKRHDPEAAARSEEFNKKKAERDALFAEQQETKKNKDGIWDDYRKAQTEQQAKYQVIKKVKDEFYAQKKAFDHYEYEARNRARERKKAENEAYQKEKRKERAQKMLAEASDKAYLDELRRAQGLIHYFDPSYSVEKAPLQAPSQFTAQAQRTVDASGLKGIKVVRKDEDDYFVGTGGKKGKKGRKGAAASDSTPGTPTGKFNCTPSVLEDCAFLNIEPPMSAADVPGVVEKIKAKIDHWKADQDSQTAKNIEKAQKEVDRLEAEESGLAPPTTEPPHANGEGKGTASVDEGGSVANEIELVKKATADVVADLKGASIEDKE